jgi:hypothetical protein
MIGRSGVRPFVRPLSVACGLASGLWVMLTFTAFLDMDLFARSAQHILSGEQYNAGQLSALRDQLNARPTGEPSRSSDLLGIAILRLHLFEAGLAASPTGTDLTNVDRTELAVNAALGSDPTNSFLWLSKYWLNTIRSGNVARSADLLRRSYEFAPNEGWIAIKRNPLALAAFESLPNQLERQAIDEFVGLVRSGLDREAAVGVSIAHARARSQLSTRLFELDEGVRRRFAGVLQAQGIEATVVPGIQERSNRPF